MNDLFRGIKDKIDFRFDARIEYETRVASKATILDVGGRNYQSRSNKTLRKLSTNPESKIVSTDIIEDYHPDLVDDICDTRISPESFDAIYCNAILEHVQDYMAAINNMHKILKPGGEIFIYVPFIWRFHDKMDYHRFTFTELERILRIFREYRLFLPDRNGYGGVLWQLLTFYQIDKLPKIQRVMSLLTNNTLKLPLVLSYILYAYKNREQTVSLKEYTLYFIHFCINHGYCGWAKK